MKKLVLAFVLVAMLALPVVAKDLRFSGTLDLGSQLNVSAHLVWTPIHLAKNAILIGPGASLVLPLHEWSVLDIYASGFVYPLNFGGGKIPWYIKLNLGYAIGVSHSGSDFSWRLGTGYEFGPIFIEGMFFGKHSDVQLGVGVKF
jgi:hypothetical protein